MIHFNLPDIRCQVQKLEEETARPDFWNDSETSSKTHQKIKNLKDKDEAFSNLNEMADEIELLIELGNEEEELSYLMVGREINSAIYKEESKCDKQILRVENLSVLDKLHKNKNKFISIFQYI